MFTDIYLTMMRAGCFKFLSIKCGCSNIVSVGYIYIYMTIISAVNNHPFLPLHLEGGGKIHWAKFRKKVQYFGGNWAIDNNVLFHFNL